MKFLVSNYSCLQNPWLGGYRPQNPILSILCHQLNLLNPLPPPPKKKFLDLPLVLQTFTWFFVSGFPTKTLYAFLFFPICNTYLTHLILLDLMAWIIFGEKYKSWSSTLYNVLLSPLTYSFLEPNIFPSNLFSNSSRYILQLRSFIHQWYQTLPRKCRHLGQAIIQCPLIMTLFKLSEPRERTAKH